MPVTSKTKQKQNTHEHTQWEQDSVKGRGK